jgi:5-methylcytosine-specific restriction endonuclease McrA
VGKLGIVRLTGDDLEALRRACFERDHYRCVNCGVGVIFERGYWYSGHMAHVRNKRMYGDTLENVRTKCMNCHLVEEHNPKSVPRKVKP